MPLRSDDRRMGLTKKSDKRKGRQSELKSSEPKITRAKKLLQNGGEGDREKDILPRYVPYIVVLVTLVIRVYYVTLPSSLWVLHPDEIYQSMEGEHY